MLSKGGCKDFVETIITTTDPETPISFCEHAISHLRFNRKYHCTGGWCTLDNYVLGNADCLCERQWITGAKIITDESKRETS